MSKAKGKIQKDMNEGIKQHANTKKKSYMSKLEFDKCGVSLTIKQNELYKGIKCNTMTVIHGPAGTSKTFTSCYAALALLANGKVSQIIITKPMEESGNSGMGFLPGDMDEKTAPYQQSFLSNFAKIIGKQTVNFLISTGEIIFEPLSFMRGSSYDDCLITGEILYTENGEKNIEEIYEDAKNEIFHNVLSYNEITNETEYKELSMIRKSKVEEYLELELEDGTITKVSLTHKFYTTNGVKLAKDLTEDDEIISFD